MPDPEDDRQIRPFADFIGAQPNLAAELSTTLNELLQAVSETGKSGTLQLTVKAKPATKSSASQVLITCAVAAKKPQADPAERVWFIDGHFNPVRDDPTQAQLPLREVPQPAAEPRTIPTASGGNQ